MKKIINKVNFKAILILLLFYILMFFVINLSNLGLPRLLQITGGTNILDFEFGYTLEKAYTTFDNMGIEGRIFYLEQIIPIDFIFPMSYMMFYFSVIAYSLKMQIIRIPKLLLVPVFAMLFDWVENIAIMVMLFNYPNRLIAICEIGSIFTIIKFIFIISSLAITVILLFLLLFKFISKMHKKY